LATQDLTSFPRLSFVFPILLLMSI
jgi:hypothetical protein